MEDDVSGYHDRRHAFRSARTETRASSRYGRPRCPSCGARQYSSTTTSRSSPDALPTSSGQCGGLRNGPSRAGCWAEAMRSNNTRRFVPSTRMPATSHHGIMRAFPRRGHSVTPASESTIAGPLHGQLMPRASHAPATEMARQSTAIVSARGDASPTNHARSAFATPIAAKNAAPSVRSRCQRGTNVRVGGTASGVRLPITSRPAQYTPSRR